MSTETISAVSQKMDFLNLLVTEMRNQNPLEPMDNKQMASQLAQFSQLELTEQMNGNLGTMNTTMTKMNNSFEGAMLIAQMDYAKSLLGKTVNFYDTSSGQTLEGQVNKLGFVNGQPVLNVHGNNPSKDYTILPQQIEGIHA